MMILGIGTALALGVFLAIALKQKGTRFRSPEQAIDDTGLVILGAVPAISSDSLRATEEAAQVVEAFRTIRTNVRNAAHATRSLTLTITSPGSKDGKSLIASNLALSFAESGARTLLIDGDLRRGELTKTFGVATRPGLIEYLDDKARIADVLHPATSQQNLTVLPTGVLRRRAPELLASPRLPHLIAAMGREYEVVIVDSPPLGAGADSYALATATGTLALVLRADITNRRMAKARLEALDTHPVRVIGAVLNGFKHGRA
jgi:capsular exopolysaccharide synthesis family protein